MNIERLKVTVRGAVQGVGFRPFVYRLAHEARLNGWVLNSGSGVFVEVEGARTALQRFLLRLERERPPRASIQGLESAFLDAVGYAGFEIRESDGLGAKTAFIAPDSATCVDCLREMLNPMDRRHHYPFTNCTNCGPRFTIIEALPYDRPNTSMRGFAMCPDCAREYHDPADRRFHAQPNACPRCGPQLEWWDATQGKSLARGDEALRAAAAAIREAKIVALKGVGGFQLLVDARDATAVARLRARKRREAKPFALMYPGLDRVRADCRVSEAEERLLLSPEAPIVLLDCLGTAPGAGSQIVDAVAPGSPTFGVMLPSSPLHHLLMRELGFPVVATSGNLTDEPICIDNHEARARLAGIADAFLVHDRPIVRHMDDSVVRVVRGREMMLRRARGYAPLPIHLPEDQGPAILAVGAHLKNSVALRVGAEVFLSQHIGDLESGPAFAAFRQVAADLPRLYEAPPAIVARDLHPEYLSSTFAAECGAPVHPVQHHYAHVLACLAENKIAAPVLGVAWDGTGYGPDGTIWGGEFLLVGKSGYERFAHLRQFRLPGGEAAIRQPRRTALGLLFELDGDADKKFPAAAPVQEFSGAELALLRRMLVQRINAPLTSSAGRLFDAVASLLGLRQVAGFEGQAAMELEFAAAQAGCDDASPYPFRVTGRSPLVIDWQPVIAAILEDLRGGEDTGTIAARFHVTLAEIIVALARMAAEPKVVLTGGCFQNRLLLEQSCQRLEDAGFRPYWHQRVPPNDGGIALGQAVAVLRDGVVFPQNPPYTKTTPNPAPGLS
jgi:hydrogenase maturation protein HypF